MRLSRPSLPPPHFGALVFICAIAGSGPVLGPAQSSAQNTATLVRDINPGTRSSSPEMLTDVAGGSLFFVARTETSGRELWQTEMVLDEPSGEVVVDTTHLVKDIHPGSQGSQPSELTGVGGEFFFIADDGESGRELWKSDGTTDGTEMVRSIRPGTESAIAPGGAGSHPGWLTAVGETLFFVANDGSRGYELWKSDGTASGTEMVKDIWPGPTGSRPGGLTNVDGTLFFAAADSSHGAELWKSDGTAKGTVMVKDVTGDSTGSAPDGLTNADGVLYFAANDRERGWELWKSDGTAAGTVLVRDIREGSESSFPAEMTPIGDSVAFRANDGTTGAELWISAGDSASTRQARDIAPGEAGSFPRHLTELGGKLFFDANDQTHGRELWRRGLEGTEMVKDIFPGSQSSIQRPIYKAGGQLFFAADDGDTGREPWVSDGTAKGTRRVTDLRPGSAGSVPQFFTEIGGKVLFSATDGLQEGKHGRELWKTATRPLVNFDVAIPDGQEGGGQAPVTEVMRGGEFARYYRLRDEDGELYIASDSVTVYLKNDSTASPDKNGLVRISGSTKEGEAFSDIRGAPAGSLPQTVELDPVDSVRVGGEKVIENTPSFDVKVRERRWRHTWERTEAFSASAGAVLLMKGRSDGTVAFTRNQDALKIHALFRLGGGLGFSLTVFELELGVLNAGCGVGGSGLGLKGSGNTHRFESPLTKEPDDPIKEKTGLVLLSALVQQSVQASPAFLLRDLIPKIKRELGFSARDHLVRTSSTWGVETKASAGCGASLSVPLVVNHGRRGGATPSAGFSLANASASLGASFTSFDRTLTNRRPTDLQETGFRTSFKKSFGVGVLGSFLETLDIDASSTTEHTVSMNAVRTPSNRTKRVTSSLGLKENNRKQTMRLILDRQALQAVAKEVGEAESISPVIRNYRGTLERSVLSWGIDWGRGDRFTTMKKRVYDTLLETVQKRAVDARLGYEVVRTRSDPRGGITVPVSASAGLAEIGFEWSYDRTFREKWLKERGVIYCPGGSPADGQTCAFENKSGADENGSPAYWTARYENDKYIDAPGQGLKSISEELLKSLENILEKHAGIWFEVADLLITPFKKNSSLSVREASVEIGAGNFSDDRGETTVKLAGWESEKNTQPLGGDQFRPVSQTYQLFPGTITLESPAPLTIGYSEDSLAAEVNERSLDIYRADLEKGQWVATGGAVDADSNEVQTEITRFTAYVVAPDRAPHAPPHLEVEPDTSDAGSVLLDWSAPEAKDLAGYHVYRSGSKEGGYSRLNSSVLSKTTFTDEAARPDSAQFYAVTAVDTAGHESARSAAVGGALSALRAAASNRIYTEQEVGFGATGVDLRFTEVAGAGQVQVTKLQGAPEDTTGLSRVHASDYRYVIDSEEGLTIGDSTEVHLDVSTLRGVGDPDTVTVFRRPLTGAGRLRALPTSYDSTAGELVAKAGSFSEFVLGSNDAANPLPVEFSVLKARLNEGEVRLRWQTASETGSAGFEVQRRRPGARRWRSLGFVESKAPGGTSGEPLSYQFTDGHIPYGADSLFYRLRQVDTDGAAHPSKAVKIARSAPSEIQLRPPFPNPARDQVTVRVALPKREQVSLRVYDVLGRRVETVGNGPVGAGRTQFQLDVSGLPSGVYFLRLRAGAKAKTQKMTIVR